MTRDSAAVRPMTAAGQIPSVAFHVPATTESVPLARERLAAFVHDHIADADVTGRVRLAVTEALSNVVRHAYAGPAGAVICEADIEESVLEVVVADRGYGFRSAASPSPGLGTGLAIIADCCDDLRITHGDGGVEVWMRFILHDETGVAADDLEL